MPCSCSCSVSLFFAVSWDGLQCVILAYPGYPNLLLLMFLYVCLYLLYADTVVPTKIDSDVILCLQLLSKTSLQLRRIYRSCVY